MSSQNCRKGCFRGSRKQSFLHRPTIGFRNISKIYFFKKSATMLQAIKVYNFYSYESNGDKNKTFNQGVPFWN